MRDGCYAEQLKDSRGNLLLLARVLQGLQKAQAGGRTCIEHYTLCSGFKVV